MKSVGNIKKITRTMEMVSVAKMKRATATAHAYRPFVASAKHILITLYNDRNIKHKLIDNKQKGDTLVILMAANKGLCGGYNAQVYKALSRNVKSLSKDKLSLITIGKYAEKMAKRSGGNIIYSFPKNNINNREAYIVAKEVINRYLDKDNSIEKVLMIHPYIESSMSYNVSVQRILPFSVKNTIDIDTANLNNSKVNNNFKYEPSKTAIVDTVIPILIEALIQSAATETEAGEHAARMIAMKTATDNAGDLLHDLKLTFNNARQAKITQEIAELSSAA